MILVHSGSVLRHASFHRPSTLRPFAPDKPTALIQLLHASRERAGFFSTSHAFPDLSWKKRDRHVAKLPDAPSWSLIDELGKPEHQSSVYQARSSQRLVHRIAAWVDSVTQILGFQAERCYGESAGLGAVLMTLPVVLCHRRPLSHVCLTAVKCFSRWPAPKTPRI